ncbi:MAG: HAD-IC family P-type ATPase, partial [Candidatus Promineifilaceae bacterium]
SAEHRLGNFVRSASDGNKTSEALASGLPGTDMAIIEEVAFASSRKWSALSFNSIVQRGVYALGAVEMLKPHLSEMPEKLAQQIAEWSEQGLRVLLFAYQPATTMLYDHAGRVALPTLKPLAVVSLGDELRPQAKETIETFRNLGIQLKVISGDNPNTVAALAKQAGFPPDMQLISGTELAAMDAAAFHQAATEGDIFGRISPEQKEGIVDALLQENLRVAMMGDGVNDVLPIKKASLGIAMESGSNATRNVADMILLNDSFAALRPAFTEGRRIISGMTSALYLFISRVATSILMIIAITMVGLSFPFEPAQVALTTFTVGIPSFLLMLWARPEPLDPNLLGSISRFVFPVAIISMLLGTGLYVRDYNGALRGASNTTIPDRVIEMYESYTGIEYGTEEFGEAAATISTQGALSTFFSYTSFLLILFLEPPHQFFTGWRKKVSPDKRPMWLVIALFVGFRIVYNIETLGSYFGILSKPWRVDIMIVVLTVVWFFAVRTIWRANLLNRALGVESVK